MTRLEAEVSNWKWLAESWRTPAPLPGTRFVGIRVAGHFSFTITAALRRMRPQIGPDLFEMMVDDQFFRFNRNLDQNVWPFTLTGSIARERFCEIMKASAEGRLRLALQRGIDDSAALPDRQSDG